MNVYAKNAAAEIGSIVRTMYELLLPVHTREGLEGLWRELQTDIPKDLSFVKRHSLALKPRTLLGWMVRLKQPEGDSRRAGLI